MSDSVRPHRRQPTRLPHPWDSPGKNTGVGCHFHLQCMKVKSESEVAQLCPTLSDLKDCSLPGSSIHGIFQARVLEWGAIAFSTWTWDGHKTQAQPSLRLCGVPEKLKYCDRLLKDVRVFYLFQEQRLVRTLVVILLHSSNIKTFKTYQLSRYTSCWLCLQRVKTYFPWILEIE